jgi:hypothetical protein
MKKAPRCLALGQVFDLDQCSRSGQKVKGGLGGNGEVEILRLPYREPQNDTRVDVCSGGYPVFRHGRSVISKMPP